MKFQEIKNPVWADAAQTIIDCEVNHPVYGWIPFTANSNDSEEHGRDAHARLLAGEFGQIAAYVAPVISAEDNKVSAAALLAATDWVNQPDVYDTTITPHLQNRDAFIAYRTQLRAIVANPVSGEVSWPTMPTAQWSN